MSEVGMGAQYNRSEADGTATGGVNIQECLFACICPDSFQRFMPKRGTMGYISGKSTSP